MGMVMLASSEQDCARKTQSNNQGLSDAIIMDVTVVSPISTIQDAAYLLTRTNRNYLVVYDGAEPVGMMSRLQLERYTNGQQGRMATLALREVMLPIPFYARIFDRLVTLRQTMTQSGLSWLPIFDEQSKLVGVLVVS